jgi:adenylate cyclase
VTGLEAGADEYLTKPVDQTSLVARVKSMLRVKELHDKIASQTADLAKWNKTLEERVGLTRGGWSASRQQPDPDKRHGQSG